MLKELENAHALKFLLIASLGFFFQKITTIPYSYFFSVSLCLLLVSIIFFLSKGKTIFVFIILFVFGLITAQRTQNLDFSYNGDFPPQVNGLFKGKVLKELKQKGITSRYIVEGKMIVGGMKQLENVRMHFTLINSKKINIKLKKDNSFFGLIKFRLPNNATLPGEFSEKNYYRAIDVDFTGFSFIQDIAVTDTTSNKTIQQEIAESINGKIEKIFSQGSSSIVKAIILGDQKSIPMEIRQNFSLSGTAHILSVSGLHVGIIASIIYWLFSFIRIPWLKFSIFSITLWSYVLLIDMQPAAVRASIMIMLYLYSKVIQRKVNPINIIALTVLIIAIFDPGTLYNAGFQMSIASIAGIALLYKPINDFLEKFIQFKKGKFLQKPVLSSLSMTLSATIIVSPIVAYYFNVFSVISPIANFVTIPLMVLAQSYAIIAIIFSYIFIPLSYIFAATSQINIELSVILTEFSANLPGAYLLGENVILVSILISLSLLILLTSKYSRQLIFRLTLVVLCSSILFISSKYFDSKSWYEIYNRPTSNYIELKEHNISIIREKPTQLGRGYDYGLLTYLSKIEKPRKIFYSGSTGLAIEEKIQNKNIKLVKIKDSKLNYINSFLNP
jgi:competence protein ComEC